MIAFSTAKQRKEKSNSVYLVKTKFAEKKCEGIKMRRKWV